MHFGVLSQVFVFPGSFGQFGHGADGFADSNISTMVGHAFVGLVFLWALLVSERPLNNISLTRRHLTSRCNQGAYFPSRTVKITLYCVHFNNSYGVGSNEPL